MNSFRSDHSTVTGLSVATENQVNVVSRSFAIVPAAGESRRMGQPKLLLPWRNWTLIDQVLQAWTLSQVDQIVVVVRSDDSPLQEACGRWPVHLVRTLETPQDMKASVCFGLSFLEQHWKPAADDRCFIAPADLPGLTCNIIDQLLQADADSSAIKVPQFGSRSGHPVLLPWSITEQIHRLPDDKGVNHVVDTNPQQIVEFQEQDYFSDVDTCQDYEQLRNQEQQPAISRTDHTDDITDRTSPVSDD